MITLNAKTDSDLLKKIAKGDKNAFKALFIKYQPQLIKYCNHVIKNDFALASEIAEEVLIDIWKTAGSYTGNSLPSTWIHSKAKFQLIAHYKNYYKKVLKIDDPLIASTRVNSSDFLFNKLLSGNSQNQLTGSRGELNKKHKEILGLVYIEELSLEELVNWLGVSENTIKKRLFHARENLKTILLNNNFENNLIE